MVFVGVAPANVTSVIKRGFLNITYISNSREMRREGFDEGLAFCIIIKDASISSLFILLLILFRIHSYIYMCVCVCVYI